MTILYFHIASRCQGGFGILDDMMTQYRNTYFYALDTKPYESQLKVGPLHCLPKSVISTCVKDIVDDQCGTMTADFVQNYLLYVRDWYGQALKSAGLNSNTCDQEASFDTVPSRPPIPPGILPGHTKLGISRLLEITAPGTALDTVFGKWLQAYLHDISEEEFCSIADGASDAYLACVMSSDDRSERNEFNILQFAHQIFPSVYHGTQCNRLELFTACWNLMQEICGPKVRGFEQHATLLVEGCKIQSEMEKVGCHWQDMLLPHYIQASRATWLAHYHPVFAGSHVSRTRRTRDL